MNYLSPSPTRRHQSPDSVVTADMIFVTRNTDFIKGEHIFSMFVSAEIFNSFGNLLGVLFMKVTIGEIGDSGGCIRIKRYIRGTFILIF